MPVCEVCQNDYDKAFEIILAGRRHVFASFECAIHGLAPKCEHCHCKIVGHGIESHSRYYCCANCAKLAGEEGARDRIS